jgi:anti-sigma-K factor RskA
MMSHEELRELIAPYVLGALPEDELPEVRSHILTCDECLTEAEHLAGATSSLALAVTDEPVPAGFTDRVMARVAADRVEPRPSSPHPLRRLLVAAGFAALSLTIVALVAALVGSRGELLDQRQVVAALVRGQGGIALHGKDAAGRAVRLSDGSIFVAAGLARPPPDKTYQLWFMRGACSPGSSGRCRIVSAGTFAVSDGLGVLRTSQDVRAYDDAAVTVERQGGAKRPHTSPVISSL